MSKKPTFFWASYADLMTSLFFIMLVLFVLSVAMLNKNVNATKAQLKKIQEIEESINKIDSTYFEYNALHKKHILKINVAFDSYSSDINDVSMHDQDKLVKAGLVIRDFIQKSDSDAKYLLIIEGQSSKDGYNKNVFENNYVLSYQRALSLVQLWSKRGVVFDQNGKCEVIISGSGQSGALRKEPDNKWNKSNQRFLIHIIPKPGIIKYNS